MSGFAVTSIHQCDIQVFIKYLASTHIRGYRQTPGLIPEGITKLAGVTGAVFGRGGAGIYAAAGDFGSFRPQGFGANVHA